MKKHKHKKQRNKQLAEPATTTAPTTESPQPAAENIGQRITMLSALRYLLAELGEGVYWRTIWHLIRRPGKLLSDFLNGKREQYLQPFQALVATLVLFGIALAVVPAKIAEYQPKEPKLEKVFQESHFSAEEQAQAEKIEWAVHFYDEYAQWNEQHLEFGLLLRSVLVIFFTWLLFRHSPREDCPYWQSAAPPVTYNFAEILTAQIYIICQLILLSTAWVLVFGWFEEKIDFHPYVFPTLIAWIVMYIDYQQLFRRRWYDTLWRTLLCAMWIL